MRGSRRPHRRSSTPSDDRVGLNWVRYSFCKGSNHRLVYDEGFNTEREPLPGDLWTAGQIVANFRKCGMAPPTVTFF